MTWWSIASYFKAHADENAKRRCKNISQKKKYIVEELQMPLQFDRVVLCSTRLFCVKHGLAGVSNKGQIRFDFKDETMIIIVDDSDDFC